MKKSSQYLTPKNNYKFNKDMSKADIQRSQVNDTHMKYVILRIDYSGVTNSSKLVDLFDKRFPRAFRYRNLVTQREVSVAFRQEDLQAISKAVSVPLNVVDKEPLYRYSGFRQGQCQATLDISQFYMCMTINCENNYDGLDKYLECFKGAISIFMNAVDYFYPQRLGIRKCRIQDFNTIEAINNVFESFVFNELNLQIGQEQSYREYRTSILDINQNKLNINVLRKRYHMTNNEQYRTSLDIDVYYQDDELLNRININQLIHIANDCEFDVYKMCMTNNYLSGNVGD